MGVDDDVQIPIKEDHEERAPSFYFAHINPVF